MSNDFHRISLPSNVSMFDAAWQVDCGAAIPHFSLSFSRDDDDDDHAGLATMIDHQLSFLELESSSTDYSESDNYDDDDFDDIGGKFSPEIGIAAEPDQNVVSSPTAVAELDRDSFHRKRKIVTPQQRMRSVSRTSLFMTKPQHRSSNEDFVHQCSSSSSSSSSSVHIACYLTATRMMSCMQRSEATRAEILALFPVDEDHPIAKKRRSIQHCFLHTQTSREGLLSLLG